MIVELIATWGISSIALYLLQFLHPENNDDE